MYIFRWNLLCDEYSEDSVYWKNVLYIHWVWNLLETYSHLDYGIYLKSVYCKLKLFMWNLFETCWSE